MTIKKVVGPVGLEPPGGFTKTPTNKGFSFALDSKGKFGVRIAQEKAC
jgi:hypothetical protein